MRVVHDATLCESHGLCVAVDPERFEIDDDDNLQVRKIHVAESEIGKVRLAVETCPRQALSLSDD